jgi:tetratricopeptide (TPR) repeat protein
MDASVLQHEMGMCLDALSSYPEAIEHFERALPLREERYGTTHPLVADTLTGMAGSLMRLGRIDDSEQALERALDLRESVYGRGSGATADIHSKLGLVDYQRGDHEAAAQHLEHAVEILERDPDSIDFDAAPIYSNLGVVYSHQEHHQRAIDMHLEALRLLEESVGPVHQRVIIPLMNLGYATRRAGHDRDALDWFRRARELHQGRPGKRLTFSMEIAELEVATGNLEDAERELDGVRRTLAGRGGPYSVRLEMTHAELALAGGNAEDAIARLRPLCRRDSPSDEEISTELQSRCDFILARALAQTGDVKASRALAAGAAQELEGLRGIEARLQRRAIESWIAER